MKCLKISNNYCKLEVHIRLRILRWMLVWQEGSAYANISIAQAITFLPYLVSQAMVLRLRQKWLDLSPSFAGRWLTFQKLELSLASWF